MFQVFFRRLLPRLGGDDDSEEEEDEKKEKTKPVEKLSDGKQQKAGHEKTGCWFAMARKWAAKEHNLEGFYDFSTTGKCQAESDDDKKADLRCPGSTRLSQKGHKLWRLWSAIGCFAKCMFLWNWLVVWTMSFMTFHIPYWECHHPNWLSYFSEG